ncbi:uncharacterized protein BP5553_01137 [Venustampulla echinocandica]|uniref:Uncharacterized protein n=1 Tax=Venustampulla echinocandica TaxID=2656787 RepID=A0A370U059_9HELO|nr:uncharacterized protein BP5553_01137 [Venustampulla echinocandica]RDL41158.1 hypothetical protein BP5553_01137 [Venustampulla echinocandica]
MVSTTPPRSADSEPQVIEQAANPPPAYPRWSLRQLQQTPGELHEEQIEYLVEAMTQEVSDHNVTRMKLQGALTRSMAYERGQAMEQGHVRYLNYIVHDLRTQIQDEKMKRIAAEERMQSLEFEKEIERELHCDYDEWKPSSGSDEPESFAFDIDYSGVEVEVPPAGRTKREHTDDGDNDGDDDRREASCKRPKH